MDIPATPEQATSAPLGAGPPTLDERRLTLAERELGLRQMELEVRKMEAQATLRQSMGELTQEERGIEVELRKMDLARRALQHKEALADTLARSPFVRPTIPADQRFAFAFGILELAPLLGVPAYTMAQNAYAVHGGIGFEVDYLAALVEQRVPMVQGFTPEIGPTDPRANQGLPEFVKVTCHISGEATPRSYTMTAATILAASWSKDKDKDKNLKDAYKSEGVNMMRRRATARLISATPQLKAAVLGLTIGDPEDVEAVSVEVVQHRKGGPALPPAPPRKGIAGPTAAALELDDALAVHADDLALLEAAATPSQREAARVVAGVTTHAPIAALTSAQRGQIAAELARAGVMPRPTEPLAVPVATSVVPTASPEVPAEVEAPTTPTPDDIRALERKVGGTFAASARSKVGVGPTTPYPKIPADRLLPLAQALEAELPPDERVWS